MAQIVVNDVRVAHTNLTVVRIIQFDCLWARQYEFDGAFQLLDICDPIEQHLFRCSLTLLSKRPVETFGNILKFI